MLKQEAYVLSTIEANVEEANRQRLKTMAVLVLICIFNYEILYDKLKLIKQ